MRQAANMLSALVCRMAESERVRQAMVKVLHHDKCFDGACSASLFTRFYRECIDASAEFRYGGLSHTAAGVVDPALLDGEENAIVDFKYISTPKLNWWFDHHLSAFPAPADEMDFEQYQAGVESGANGRQQKFFDPDFISCTGYIAKIASTRFGMDVAPLKDLIYWANIVDGAKYESAEAAVGMREPAMQLTMVIESSPDDTLVGKLIPLLTEMPLSEVLAQDFVQAQLGPLMERHRQGIELIRERAFLQQGVVSFDVMDQPAEGYSKFIPYFLYPEATYAVGLSRSSSRVKVSVGTSPWTTLPASDLANISTVCQRYGGGGHARVGAVSFKSGDEESARTAAGEIIAELRGVGEGAG